MLIPKDHGDSIPAGGRAERRERSRRRILDAARAVLTERDDSRVTVREIAARAEVSPGLVMQHFGTMADLVLEVFMEANTGLEAMLHAAAEEDGPPRAKVLSAFRQLAARDLDRPLLTSRLMAGAWSWSQSRGGQFRENIVMLTRRLMEMLDEPAGSTPPATLEAAAIALMSIYNLLLRRALEGEMDAGDLIARMTAGFDLVLAGLDAHRRGAPG